MHKLHGFACISPPPADLPAPVLACPDAIHAPELKPIHKVGRRGGERIARIINQKVLEGITWGTSHYMQVVMKEFSSYVMVMFSFINI